MDNADTRTTRQLLEEIGRRLRQLRISAQLTTAEVADRAGLARQTVENAERGLRPSLETMVRVLRAVGRTDLVDAFLPPVLPSPLDQLDIGRPRRRVRRKGPPGDR